jgi:hypothetical protein
MNQCVDMAAVTTHFIVGDADRRDGVRVCPHDIFHKFHPIFLQILATVTECLPVDLPLQGEVRQRLQVVCVIPLIRLNSLLSSTEPSLEFLELLTLDQRRLRGE